MFKSLTAGVLAAALTATSLSPTVAAADVSREEAVLGIGALLLLGAAIHNNNNDNDRSRDRSRPTVNVTRDRQNNGNGARQNDHWRVLPANCLYDDRSHRGQQVRYFGQRCLSNNYANLRRLPQACHIRFRTQRNEVRQGFGARCLRDAGFRTTRR